MNSVLMNTGDSDTGSDIHKGTWPRHTWRGGVCHVIAAREHWGPQAVAWGWEKSLWKAISDGIALWTPTSPTSGVIWNKQFLLSLVIPVCNSGPGKLKHRASRDIDSVLLNQQQQESFAPVIQEVKSVQPKMTRVFWQQWLLTWQLTWLSK